MASFVQLTPLAGALAEGHVALLLEIDDARILLDCGWAEALDPLALTPLARIARQIDAVLLSHPDIDHIAAYPYAAKHLGLLCPAYATTPVHDMGSTCIHDLLESKLAQEEFSLFSAADIDFAFEKINLLKYSQPVALTGKCQGITITAFSAGHTVGGTIWKIKKDTEDIVYAIDYNHRKERHLNGTALLSDPLARPSLLITDAYNVLVPDQPARKYRDLALVGSITSILNSNGNVLIPTDSSARVLELLYMLDQLWAHNRFSYPLVFLSNQSQNTINLARSMLEWMGDAITEAFAARETPFGFKCARIVHSLEELEALPSPKIVLASCPGMNLGFSHDLLLMWGKDERNAVILPSRGQPGTLTRFFYEVWSSIVSQKSESSAGSEVRPMVPLNSSIPFRFKKRVPLQGDELQEYLDRKKLEQELEIQRRQLALDQGDESDESDDDEVVVGRSSAGVAGEISDRSLVHTSYDIYVKDSGRTAGFFKQAQAFRMFPVHEQRYKVDDYGEVIDPAFFARLEAQNVPDDLQPASATSAGPAVPQADDVAMTPAAPKDAKPEKPEVPSKYIEEDGMLSVSCKFQHIDFEGRADSRSVKNILAQVAPRKILIIRGDAASTQALASYCKNSASITHEVYTPAIGECINVSSAHNLHQVVLTDPLASALQLIQHGDYNLGLVSGVVRLQQSTATGGGTRALLDVLPLELRRSRRPVVVGDTKLSEIRKILQSEGFSTQFASGGVLVVNGGSVVLRRTAVSSKAALTGSGKSSDAASSSGVLTIEGRGLSQDYFDVRKLLYTSRAILRST